MYPARKKSRWKTTRKALGSIYDAGGRLIGHFDASFVWGRYGGDFGSYAGEVVSDHRDDRVGIVHQRTMIHDIYGTVAQSPTPVMATFSFQAGPPPVVTPEMSKARARRFSCIHRERRQDDVALKAVMELASMEAIKELVKLKLGVSILAPWIAQKELKEKSLMSLPLGKRKLKRGWGIACRRGRRLNITEETFIRLCRAATENMVGSAAAFHRNGVGEKLLVA